MARIAILIIPLFVLLSVIADDSVYTITEIKHNPGIYYENFANLKLYNDEWKLITYLDLLSYHQEHKYVTELFAQVQHICIVATERNVESSECKALDKTLSNSLQGIRNQNSIIFEMLGLKSHNRDKRGLFNIVGSVSKTLFGTLDENDAKYYDSQINKLNRDQAHISNLLKQQMSVFENTVHAINITASDSKFYYATLNNKLSETISFINNLVKNDTAQQFGNDISIKLDEVVSLFNNVYFNFKNVQDNLVNIIFFAIKGMLHPLVLSPTKIVEQLSNLQNYLDGLEFPISPSIENAHLFYNLVNVNVYFSDNRLCFVIFVPLTDKRIFNVMKISSLPKLVSNSSYVFIQPQSGYLVIDTTKQHYFLMNKFELSKCIKVQNYFLYEQNKPLNQVHLHGGCEANLFTPTNDIPKSCDKRIVNLSNPIFIQLEETNSWLFVVPKEENVDIICKQSNKRTSLKLHNTGILKLNSNCSAYMKSIILNTHSKFSSKVIIEYVPPLDLNEELYNITLWAPQESVPSLLQTPLLISKDDTDTLRRVSNEIAKFKVLADQGENHINSPNVHNIIAYSLIIILCIILTGVSSLSYYMYKKAYKPHPQNDKTDNILLSVISDKSVKSEEIKKDDLPENCASVPRYNFQK